MGEDRDGVGLGVSIWFEALGEFLESNSCGSGEADIARSECIIVGVEDGVVGNFGKTFTGSSGRLGVDS